MIRSSEIIKPTRAGPADGAPKHCITLSRALAAYEVDIDLVVVFMVSPQPMLLDNAGSLHGCAEY